MKALKGLNKKNLLKIIACFILGLLAGAIIINLRSGHHIDYLYQENLHLRATLDEREATIKILEEKISSSTKWLAVQEIKVSIIFPDSEELPNNEALKLALENKCRSLLKDIRGKRVKSIDPDLLLGIIQDRVLEIEDYKFKLNVIWLLISEELQFKIKAPLVQ